MLRMLFWCVALSIAGGMIGYFAGKRRLPFIVMVSMYGLVVIAYLVTEYVRIFTDIG